MAGATAVLFQVLMNGLFNLTYGNLASCSIWIFLVGSFAVIISTSLAVGYLLNSFSSQASGSGIPQLKLAFWKDFGYVPWRVVWVKFLAGVLSVGGGASLGREGPSVHFAGGLASVTAGLLGEPKQNRRRAAAAGAAAGLAAAFNTPLAALTFVLEEIVSDFNSRFLGSVLLASVIGAFVVHGLLGEQPAFNLVGAGAPSWKVYVLTPLVAAAASLIGMLFQKLTLGLRKQRKHFKRVPVYVRPAIGGLITWALGSTVFIFTGRLGVFGLGYEDLSAALANELTWQIAGILLITKLVATFTCYGYGSSGGIFSPCLFLGGMCGVFISGIIEPVFPMPEADHILLAVVGTSACLGAVVRAPITGMLIVFEMTHEFSLVPALMLGALVSQAISRRLAHHSFYEAILIQDGHSLEHVIPPRDLQSWQQLPVSSIANFRPVIAQALDKDSLNQILQDYPYQRFPALQDGKLAGIITRALAQSAIAEDRPLKIEPVSWCLPTHTIRELQAILIESTTFMAVLLDRPDGNVLGLITLHDLLRAEVSMAKRANS